MYQVLYRKWRPAVFEDVVGQPQVTVTLRNEITSGRLGHAYLFTGSRGTGKTTCAKILAKAVNCLHPVNGDPCNQCEICKGIDDGSILDVVEIDAASNNGVDNIRDLREEAAFTPAAAKYRVYIIDEAHMLSTGAFNALLKTLEEPPPYVLFILATTEVHKIPATILSRCQRFDFGRISPEEMAKRLEFVAKEEGIALTHDAALLLGRLADGALRDGLSLLDQCIGAGGTVTEEVVEKTAGLAGHDYLFELSDAVFAKDTPAALLLIDRLHQASQDMSRLCEELISHFRAMMLLKTMSDPKALLVCSQQELARLQQAAQKTTLAGLLHILSTLQSALERLAYAPNRRVEMELTLIRMTSPELDASSDALLRRVKALETAVRTGQAVLPAVKEEEPGSSAPAPAVQKPQEATTACQHFDGGDPSLSPSLLAGGAGGAVLHRAASAGRFGRDQRVCGWDPGAYRRAQPLCAQAHQRTGPQAGAENGAVSPDRKAVRLRPLPAGGGGRTRRVRPHRGPVKAGGQPRRFRGDIQGLILFGKGFPLPHHTFQIVSRRNVA